MEIMLIAAVLLAVAAYLFVMQYNLHMFQLNGYKNGEHMHWLQKNISKQGILILVIAVGILTTFIDAIFLNGIFCLALLLTIWYYRYLKQQKNKKKMVYTNRVKRMVITNSIISMLCMVIAFVLGGGKALWMVMGILLAAQPFMMLLVNTINKPVENGINQHYVNDAKKKLAEVPGLQIIGVTGSYGKTSVKYYLHTLLQSKYNVLITPESYNTPMGVVRTIREQLKSTHEIFICEMGARHVGDIKEICDIVHPKHGMITSIGPQHLETFFNMENIQNTKFELADALPADGMLFLNGDNTYIQEKSVSYQNKIFYHTTVSDGNGYYAENVKVSQLGTEFDVVTPDGETEHFQMRLIGGHNVINVVGAIAVAHKLGISLKELRVPVRMIQPVAHRLQMLEKGFVTIIDDAYNSNPIGSKAAVETLAMFEGVRILVTPGMVELGKEEEKYNYEFGTYAAKCCDYVALVGKKHTEPIAKGLRDSGFAEDRLQTFEKLEEALSYAYSIKENGHKYILLENDLPDNY
ncbi:MAG: UDP-N-acetylmuramoyl-tripeptide--D-alanyl-D-alanine ligase [Lachnospiraceae bacterium]|nr:UDP-N-acetylmuramoyl-tripeptide--D-alanyl-D-alanine ligase [Lachnospiraceae bacterium]